MCSHAGGIWAGAVVGTRLWPQGAFDVFDCQGCRSAGADGHFADVGQQALRVGQRGQGVGAHHGVVFAIDLGLRMNVLGPKVQLGVQDGQAFSQAQCACSARAGSGQGAQHGDVAGALAQGAGLAFDGAPVGGLGLDREVAVLHLHFGAELRLQHGIIGVVFEVAAAGVRCVACDGLQPFLRAVIQASCGCCGCCGFGDFSVGHRLQAP